MLSLSHVSAKAIKGTLNCLLSKERSSSFSLGSFQELLLFALGFIPWMFRPRQIDTTGLTKGFNFGHLREGLQSFLDFFLGIHYDKEYCTEHF